MDQFELQRMLRQGEALQDLMPAEYAFVRRFCELVQPKRVTCVGGHSNLDVFYTLQDQACEVTNWDPGDAFLAQRLMMETHRRLQEATNFQGRYHWQMQSVGHLNDVTDGTVDLLWVNCLQAQVPEIKQWPDHLIMYHWGYLPMTRVVLQTHSHLPLVALGRTIAIFSRAEAKHDWRDPAYHLATSRALGHINPVREIIR